MSSNKRVHSSSYQTHTYKVTQLVSIPLCLLAEQKCYRSAEQRQNSAGQDQETADHWDCTCVAKISAATIYFAVGLGSCSFGILTRFQDCCLSVFASSLSTATTSVHLPRDVDTIEFNVYLGTPGNTEENNNSRSKTNFSFQFIAIYVCYTKGILAGDLLFGLKFVKLSILPTHFIHFV